MTQVGNELALLADARSSLERARSLSEVKAILDVAVAAKKYAEAKKLGEESLAFAQEIINRAVRRMGEMLASAPKNQGGRPRETPSDTQAVSPPTLKDLGISETASHRAQQIAKVPDAVFEASVAKPQNRLLRVAREAAADQRRAEHTEPQTTHGLVDIRHGDFREVLGDLVDVDAIITDPPYPRQFWDPYEGESVYVGLAELARRVLKPNGVLAVMTGTRLEMLDAVDAQMGKHLRRRHRAVYLTPGQRWRDQNERVATGYKPILIFAHPDADDLRWINDDVFSSSGTREQDVRFHHWGQSESGFASLVERLTEPGQLVLDPFLGGGTTAVVCRDLGRRFIGCDIDAAHVATSRERVA